MNHLFNKPFSRIIKLSILLCSVALIISCSSRQLLNPQSSIERLSKGGNWQSEVDRLAKPLIDSKTNVGLIVAIIDENQQTMIFPYGHKNLKIQNPITSGTLFAIGSTTKSLIVSLMLILDDLGIISVEDKIGDLLPDDLSFKDPRILDISFLQLASHTSGLPREPANFESLKKITTYFFTGKNIYSHLTQDSMYAFLEKHKLPKDPSTDSTYSNIGIGLLAHFLTLKTGHDLEFLLKKYLFTPLQMNDTKIFLDASNNINLATGYVGDQPLFIARNTPLKNWTFSSVMLGTGGVYSTAGDLIKYLKAHLGISNTPLDDIMQKSHDILGRDGDHLLTMGWYADFLPHYNKHLYYYHGMIAGFNSYIGFEPDSQVAVVVLRNNFNWDDVVGHNLLLRLSQYARFRNH